MQRVVPFLLYAQVVHDSSEGKEFRVMKLSILILGGALQGMDISLVDLAR